MTLIYPRETACDYFDKKMIFKCIKAHRKPINQVATALNRLVSNSVLHLLRFLSENNSFTSIKGTIGEFL